MENEKIKNKWNKLVKPFSAYTETQRQDLLDFAQEVTAQVKKYSGLDCFLAYGTLLGSVRDQDLIPHDDDIDMAIACGSNDRVGVAKHCKEIMECFLADDYEIKAPSYGQFKVKKKQPNGGDLAVELFASWFEGDNFFLYFAVPGKPIRESVTPLREKSFLDRKFFVPNNPEYVLQSIYGEDWTIPDPVFSYNMTPEKWGTFKLLFFSRNVHYWNKYYSAKASNSMWASLPSQFCTFVCSEIEGGLSILEIGCGNGRDSVFFAQNGHEVTSCDYSREALNCCADFAKKLDIDVKTKFLNVYDVPKLYEFSKENASNFDIVYARFFVHAISLVGEENFLNTAFLVLKPGGRLYVEFRTMGDSIAKKGKDIGHNERLYGHYRRFINPKEFIGRATGKDFFLEYSVIGKGMAKYWSEDPEICRAIFVKT